jgi:hypothetical protein
VKEEIPPLFQLDEYSNRVANCLLAAGFKHGQSIALFMENRYLCSPHPMARGEGPLICPV